MPHLRDETMNGRLHVLNKTIYLKNRSYKWICLFVHGEDDTTAHLFHITRQHLGPFLCVFHFP